MLSELDSLTARRVLVIDDDPAARYLLHKLLEDSNVCVIEARDGRSGLAAARRSKPALIFLDLNLPDLGGEDVLEELRADAESAGSAGGDRHLGAGIARSARAPRPPRAVSCTEKRAERCLGALDPGIQRART